VTEVALSSLKPIYRRIYKDFDPRTGGTPTDEFELSFTCPVCGPPSRIAINIGPSLDTGRHIWQVTPAEPFMGWADVMTVSPSIGWENVGHGKHRPPCTFHGHIIAGKVQFPGAPSPALVGDERGGA
jgi:hypothetical protein